MTGEFPYQTMVEEFRHESDEFIRRERQEAFEFLQDAEKHWFAYDRFLVQVARATVEAGNQVLIERDVYGVR